MNEVLRTQSHGGRGENASVLTVSPCFPQIGPQTAEAARLDKLIWANLEDIGYGG
jgi:hypothetical protein